MNKSRVWFLFLTFLLAATFLFIPRLVLAKERKGRVVLFFIDGVSWQELNQDQLPSFQKLIREGAVGSMSNRGYLGISSDKAFLSLGTGQRVNASGLEGLAGNIGEGVNGYEAKALYLLQTDYSPGDCQVLHLNLPAVTKFQEEQSAYTTVIGALGEVLHEGGVKTACLGNSDTGLKNELNTLKRLSVVVAMDSKGRVDRGDVSKQLLLFDRQSPYGVRLDLNRLYSKFQAVFPECSFIVVDFGDVARADRYSESVFPEQAEKIKREALLRADVFLSRILTLLDKDRDLLLIVAPTPPSLLLKPVPPSSPAIVWGKGFQSGLITSPGTKREGLVSNVDIAPTILEFFGLAEPVHFTGQSIKAVSFQGNKIDFLQQRLHQALLTDTIRGTIVTVFVVLQVILYSLLLISILAKRSWPSLIAPWRILTVFALSFPLSFYLLPLFVTNWESPWLGSAIALSLMLLIALAASYYFQDRPQVLLAVSLPTVAFFLIDLSLRSPLSLDSVFGYSSLIGARFYGLGNEGMAIFLGATILSLALILKPEKMKDKSVWAALLLFSFLLLAVVGAPFLGADVGGTLTFFFALGIFLWRLSGAHFSWQRWLLMACLALILITAFALYDLSRPAVSQTHLGRTLSLVGGGQWESLSLTFARKAETNWRVLRYSTWSYLFCFIFLVLIFLNYRPTGWLKDLLARQPVFSAAFAGSLTGGVVGFITNDSGIVIPALIMSYFMAVLFWHLHLDFDKKGLRKV